MQIDTDGFTQLIERVKAGDDAAIAQLFAQFGTPLQRSAQRLIGDRLRSQLDSVDLLQSVQIVLWLGLRTGKFEVNSPDAFLALANTLLRRKTARYCRDNKLQLTTISDASLADTVIDQALFPVSDEPNPHESTEFDDLVSYFLDQLGDLDRRLVKLRLLGYSTADAARHLNLDPGHLRVRLGRLRKRFAQFQEKIRKMPAEDLSGSVDSRPADESIAAGSVQDS